MTLLTITSANVANPQTVDLSPYLDLTDGSGADPADPAFTSRVWSRSLLKEGATLSLTQLTEKELTFPLHLGPVGGAVGAPATLIDTLHLIQKITQILETPGAICTWQPPGASQATTFDILTGQFEPAYSYWAENQKWESGNLRIFTEPLGRMAGPRLYASASGVGPLLLISPYASSSAQAISASTQAGVSGYGGQQQGASSGVFYWGSPSLAGDAPAQLQISYVGPLPNTATNMGVTPYAVVSLLPDQNYRPLFPIGEAVNFATLDLINQKGAVASQYGNSSIATIGLNVTPSAGVVTQAWAGQHRMFAIARASAGPASLQMLSGPLVKDSMAVQINPGDWQLYDLGTISFKASQSPYQLPGIDYQVYFSASAVSAFDITAFAMLPENSSWFLNPTTISPSQYGAGNLAVYWQGIPPTPYTNTLLIDDTLGDQFMYGSPSQTSAPSPAAMLSTSAPITAYTRGLVPQPDPKNGLPIIAILSVAQQYTPSFTTFYTAPGASWPNSQQLRTMAQVTVLERARYVFG